MCFCSRPFRSRRRPTGSEKNDGRPAASTLNYRVNLAGDERGIFNLINRERGRRGLGRLVWDDGLAGMARSYSRKMAKENFFSHFDGEGNGAAERAVNTNINDWSKIGENLFFCEGYDEFDRLAVRGWMDSPTHRDNVLDRRYNASGIGVAQSRNGEIYITQIFVQR